MVIRSSILSRIALLALLPTVSMVPRWLSAESIVLRDGRELKGSISPAFADIAQKPATNSSETGVGSIIMVDNDLTRTFVPKREIVEVRPADGSGRLESIKIRQRVAKGSRQVFSVGPVVRITPFDEYGRRLYSMMGPQGKRLDIVQGITEINPIWTSVESLMPGSGPPYIWDMRLSTSSIPLKTLDTILKQRLRQDDEERRLQIVRLYLQSKRYQIAEQELQRVIEDFPDSAEGRKPLIVSLRQLTARQILEELKLRQSAGQFQFVSGLLEKFPTEGVAGESLVEVRQIYDAIKSQEKRIKQIRKQFAELLTKVDDKATRSLIRPIGEEIFENLNLDNLSRMTSFSRLGSDDRLTAESKLSLAISGWLVGSDSADQNLAVTLSLAQVRDLVKEYLRSDDSLERTKLLEELETQEAASPKNLAEILKNMRPPREDVKQSGDVEGYFRLSAPDQGAGETIYHVQLPPEYNPYRKYPTIVTLHGEATSAEKQLDWWAGVVNSENRRRGQAMRHGYIVISVQWTRPRQLSYEYSLIEHAAVTSALRDAQRHFSVNTDRVFLSGHSLGGNAVWDIALAHPDLWAGAIPIVAESDKYCSRYTENGRGLPLYFVGGELDGDRMVNNARELNRYFSRIGYDVTVVEYRGRGHEHFFAEIQNLFDWMGRKQRNFSPRKFEAVTMRPWDNYFWWVEVDQLPPRSIVLPKQWLPKGARPMTIKGSVLTRNNLRVSAGAGKISVWLSPDIVDFSQRIRVQINGRRKTLTDVGGDIETMLEDARRRVDRQHVFWARVTN